MSSRDETTRGPAGGDLTGGHTASDDLADAITGGGSGPGLVDQIPLGGPPRSESDTTAGAGSDRLGSDAGGQQGGSDDDVTTGANLGGVGA